MEPIMIIYRYASTLAFDLGIPVKTLYAVSNSLDKHYHTALLPKHDGTFRQLTVPDEALKRIQRAITQHLLAHMAVSPHATAYRFGGSIFRNAAPHTGKACVVKLDIRHFFDSILYSAVKDVAFPPEIFAPPLRILLTMLCYHRESLPQGAPSSPAITNLLLRSFDDAVGAWCDARAIAYTRYCDDMTFSGDCIDVPALLALVRPMLRAKGFFLNEAKTQVCRAGQRQSVTGLTVNERVGVPAAYRKRLRQELYYAQRFGIESHLRAKGIAAPPHKYLTHLLGQVNFVLQAPQANKAFLQHRAWLLEQLRLCGQTAAETT